MNIDQRQLFNFITESIKDRINGDKKRERILIHGGAGTGKTVLFNLLKNQVNWCYGKLVVKVGALTGVEAQFVGGSTLHHLLKLPVQKDGVIVNMPHPSVHTMDLKGDPEDDLKPRRIPERTAFPKVPVHPVVPDVSLILSANIPKSSKESSRQLDVNPSKTAQELHVIRPLYSYKANQPILRKSGLIKSSVNDPDRFSSPSAADPYRFGPSNSCNRMGNASLLFPCSKSYPDNIGLAQIDDPTNQKKILVGKPVYDPEIPSVLSLTSGNVIGHVEKPVSNEQKNNATKTSMSNDPRVSSKRTLCSKKDKKVTTHEYLQKSHHLCLPAEQDSSKRCQKIKSKHKCVCDVEDSCSSGEDILHSSNYDQNLQSMHFTDKTSIKGNQSPSKLCTESVLKAQWEINKETAEVIGKLFEVNEAQFQMIHDILVKVTNLQLSQEKFIDELKKPTEVSMKCSCLSHDTSKQHPPSKESKDSSSLPKISVLHKTTQTSPGISTVSVGIMTEQPYATCDYDDTGKKGHFPRTAKSDSVRKPECPSSSTIKYQNAGDESLALNDVEIVTLQQPDPSPQPSLHLDLQDFRESSEEETESNCGTVLGKNSKATSDETSQDPTGAGWTLYNNVVGQVNKYLRAAPGHQGGKRSSEKENINHCSSLGQTATSVEEICYTTIEQIHKLGVSVYEGSTEIKEVSTTRRMKFDSTLHPYLDWQETGMTEKSTEMDSSLQKDALALKYLSDDQINAAYAGQNGVRFYNLGQKCTNMSAATLQYLEKYKLLPHFTDELEGASGPAWRRAEARRGRMPAEKADKIEGRQETSHPASHRREVAHPVSHRPNMHKQTGKILDITNLKKQPKLL